MFIACKLADICVKHASGEVQVGEHSDLERGESGEDHQFTQLVMSLTCDHHR